MNIEQLITQVCDADRRTTDPATAKRANALLVRNLDFWRHLAAELDPDAPGISAPEVTPESEAL